MTETEVVLFAVPWCGRCRRVRRLLEAAGVPYREANPETDAGAAQALGAATGGTLDVPAVRVGEAFLVDPDDDALAAALGVAVPEDLDAWDVAIVGAGPAGLTAAIYAAREGLRTLVLDRAAPGGQAAITGRIENYPGFPDPVDGAELMERVHRQAQRFGAEIHAFEEVEGLEPAARGFRLRTSGGARAARCVIVATGSVYRRLGVPGEEALIGRGVSFCATCDAPFFRDRHVVVVGGGNSALQEAVHLTEFAARVTLVEILDRLTASRVLQERIRATDRVEVLLSHRVERILGSQGVEAVEVRDLARDRVRRIECDGVFVFVGLAPNSAFLRGVLALDPDGFVAADPRTLETSVPGVFAAGDVRAGSAKQITAATGEGTVASFMARRWLASRGGPAEPSP